MSATDLWFWTAGLLTGWAIGVCMILGSWGRYMKQKRTERERNYCGDNKYDPLLPKM